MTSQRNVLFTATIAKHILRFHLPFLKWFKEQGYTTYVACVGDEEIPFCDHKIFTPFVRSPYSLTNIKAYRTLRNLLNSQRFDLIHCHTPVASVVTRLAARNLRNSTMRVIYTAHGFHFFKNGPLLNWITYYPVEVLVSYFTDAIITINQEDYRRSSQWPFNVRANKFIINGMGVNNERFTPITEDHKASLRRKHGFKENSFILIYVGEFIERKNHRFVLRSLAEMKMNIPNLVVLFAGRGELLEEMKKLATDLEVSDIVIFLGFREDVNELMQLADVGLSASKQEGLGLNLVEEMFCGLPIVATKDRGHRELIEDGVNGYLFRQGDRQQFISYIYQLYLTPKMREQMRSQSIKKAQKFSLSHSLEAMAHIYNSFLSVLV